MVRTAFSRQRSRGVRYPRMDPPPEPPDGTAEAARLAAAALAAAADLAPHAGGKTVDKTIETLGRCREATADGALPELGAVGKLEFKPGNTKALQSPACGEYLEALTAYKAIVMARDERRTQELLAALVEGYGDHLERLKRERSGLDFEDLELITRDLLTGNEGIRLCPTPSDSTTCWWTSSRTSTPAAERAARPAGTRQPVPRRGRAPVDLRLSQCRRRGVQRAPRRGGRGGQGAERDRELPQPPRGAGRDRPRLHAAVGGASSR